MKSQNNSIKSVRFNTHTICFVLFIFFFIYDKLGLIHSEPYTAWKIFHLINIEWNEMNGRGVRRQTSFKRYQSGGNSTENLLNRKSYTYGQLMFTIFMALALLSNPTEWAQKHIQNAFIRLPYNNHFPTSFGIAFDEIERFLSLSVILLLLISIRFGRYELLLLFLLLLLLHWNLEFEIELLLVVRLCHQNHGARSYFIPAHITCSTQYWLSESSV